MIPARYASVLFAALLALVMTFVVTGITTLLNVGLPPDFLARWMRAWLPTWAIAFPTLLAVRPGVQRLVRWLVRQDPPSPGTPR